MRVEKMAEEDFIGCISCLGTNNLCDLFAPLGENIETYAKLLDNCFDIKVSKELKFICTSCIQKVGDARMLKEQTLRNMAILLASKDEEYLDESILAEADGMGESQSDSDMLDVKPEYNNNDDKTNKSPILSMSYDLMGDSNYDVDTKHECDVCKVALESRRELREHLRGSHGIARDNDDQKDFQCHFCDNSYCSRKACYTHLRMKHGLKLINDQTPKHSKRERKKCHICGRDFSQKQILNKHLLKEHGVEVEKRKALDCPLCEERVSYGAYFSDHLLAEHDIEEVVDELQFATMDEFMMYKSSIQEETKYRFRKTTATKQTIEGLRSHYMCSQSGVYVYQGKGIRPAPERQIYKTGKACPAHMVVTEAVDCVKVVFHKTHVGHGACPYYEPRDSKRQRGADSDAEAAVDGGVGTAVGDEGSGSRLAWICDTCGMVFFEVFKFKQHIKTHNVS